MPPRPVWQSKVNRLHARIACSRAHPVSLTDNLLPRKGRQITPSVSIRVYPWLAVPALAAPSGRSYSRGGLGETALASILHPCPSVCIRGWLSRRSSRAESRGFGLVSPAGHRDCAQIPRRRDK
jgi:hypothetical protein